MTETDARELVVPATLKEVDRVRRFLHDYLGGLGLTEEDELKIELALHEICVNIALYAYPEGREGDLAIRIWRDDGTLFMEIRDRGVLFDPVKKPNPDVLARLRSGKRGGLGVFFFRTMMDGLSYRRDGGENILTVSKNI
ncbi:MAG: ATP-binding protein [Acidobacteria bacterium]|nr:ATP-binding protein [Acidobacteriota bacterium]